MFVRALRCSLLDAGSTWLGPGDATAQYNNQPADQVSQPLQAEHKGPCYTMALMLLLLNVVLPCIRLSEVDLTCVDLS